MSRKRVSTYKVIKDLIYQEDLVILNLNAYNFKMYKVLTTQGEVGKVTLRIILNYFSQ